MSRRLALATAIAITALIAPVTSHALLASAVPRCYVNQLALKPVATSGGLGHLGMEFSVRNRSTRVCSLYGYPGVTLLNAKKKNLPTRVTWGVGYLTGAPGKKLVTLRPQQKGYVGIEWVHLPSPGESCPVSRHMAIIPPNDYRAIVVYTGPVQACGGKVTATPVEPRPEDGFPKPGTEPGIP